MWFYVVILFVNRRFLNGSSRISLKHNLFSSKHWVNWRGRICAIFDTRKMQLRVILCQMGWTLLLSLGHEFQKAVNVYVRWMFVWSLLMQLSWNVVKFYSFCEFFRINSSASAFLRWIFSSRWSLGNDDDDDYDNVILLNFLKILQARRFDSPA